LPEEHLLDVFIWAEKTGGTLAKGEDRGLKALRFVPLKDLRRMSFLPREVTNRFEKDWKAGFPEGIVHLGRYKE